MSEFAKNNDPQKYSWNKSTLSSTFMGSEKEDGIKKSQNLNIYSSTLSLHIEAYENSSSEAKLLSDVEGFIKKNRLFEIWEMMKIDSFSKAIIQVNLHNL